MAKVILVSHGNRDAMSGQVLREGCTDEQARQIANEYNAEHFHLGKHFAKIIMDESRLRRSAVAWM